MTDPFERLDLLGLPVVLVYATDGTGANRLSGDNPYKQFTEKDVEIAVLDQLNQLKSKTIFSIAYRASFIKDHPPVPGWFRSRPSRTSKLHLRVSES